MSRYQVLPNARLTHLEPHRSGAAHACATTDHAPCLCADADRSAPCDADRLKPRTLPQHTSLDRFRLNPVRITELLLYLATAPEEKIK